MTRFSKETNELHKHICFAFGTNPLECIVELELNGGQKPAVETSAIYYKTGEDQQTQMECHIMV